MNIGLTGGMGCGKSTAGKAFAALGWRRLDSDAVVKDDLLRDPAILARLRERWGATVIAEDGTLDRARVAKRIFADDAERLWLEALLHPRVKARWEAALVAEPAAHWVVEVPLLFEKGLEKGFDFVVCVSASSEIQLARLKERGIPRALAEQRILKQLPLEQKQQLSHAVLFNDGGLAFLHEQVALLSQRLLSRR